MKTIMVIFGAETCACDCFLASNTLFDRIYPGDGPDIEFIQDILAGERDALDEAFAEIRAPPVRKSRCGGPTAFCSAGFSTGNASIPTGKTAIFM